MGRWLVILLNSTYKEEVLLLKSRPTSVIRDIVDKTDYIEDYKVMLDLGCGLGHDAKFASIDSYDPYHNITSLKNNYYDIILCTYVFNITSLGEHEEIIRMAVSLLREEHSFLAVATLKNASEKFKFAKNVDLASDANYRKYGFTPWILSYQNIYNMHFAYRKNLIIGLK